MSAAVDRPPRRRGRGSPRVQLGGAAAPHPALLPIVVRSALPLARGIYLGFTDSAGRARLDDPLRRLENFRKLLHDRLFLESFKIGLIGPSR